MKKKSIPIGRPSVLRYANAHGILKLLRECGSCSRADLVRASGLSAPTVTNVVKDLLAEDLVEPLGEGESSGGRPPDMIRFKAERGCLLGVELSAESISFLLTDLNGSELDMKELSIAKRKTTPEAICGYIGEELKLLLRKHRKTREQLLALVVGVPAITNVDEGSVLSISTLDGWRSVPLRAMLSKVVNCLVIAENDINLAAQGESYCGAAQAEKDFVLIHIGTNVGAGIFLGGKIHHGSQWSAGEIAYLRLPSISRRQPTIHEFGELETVLTSSGILRSWHEDKGKPASGVMRSNREVDAAGILNLAQAGDVRAEKIVHRRAEIVADIIINLSLILNPGLILLGGEIGSHPVMIDFVRKQLEGGEFALTRVMSSAPGNRSALWGAIALALQAVPGVLLPQP
ncbi:ROK-family transcriptional regulator [Acidisarcina polymorpha]|uniref:ROK-family transcriptional regulator n=1 Tax=Acidisarcina polymorpha TaxID=2211140 RepID=A0A2Z5FZ70_9BACT|nr:ROK family transcriptional regulator [Acidisarcina polymorpha]AXC11705.1 ROK-family transcriptional regulator [Acidisarcina polymorpha]